MSSKFDKLNLHFVEDLQSIFGLQVQYSKKCSLSSQPVSQTNPSWRITLQFVPKWLGVTVSHSLSLLCKKNFTNLIEKIKLDIQRWNTLTLLFVGQIETIKINVLQWLLFLFQTLPLFLPKSFFYSLNATISSFIWAGKPPRIQKAILQRPKKGGLALPNMLLYYLTANLQKLKNWCHSPDINWCILAASSCTSAPLPALLFAPLSLRPSLYTNNPTVLSSLKIWKQFRQHFGLKSPSILAPICGNHSFLPSALDPAINKWKEKGLISFYDLCFDETFGSFENLVTKFGISNLGLFRYFQVRNFARTHLTSFPELSEKTLLGNRVSSLKLPNNIYNVLLSSQLSCSLIYMIPVLGVPSPQ